MSEEATYTVDELARRAGTLTTTVRMYQNRGLLQPPAAKRGRIATYGPEHLDRLRLIATLQERGHSLAGIKELLDGWESGDDLAGLLGLTSWGAPRPVVMPVVELLARFGGQPVTQQELQRAERLGLIALDGDSVRVADVRFLDVGAELIRMGIPAGVLLDEWVWLGKRSGAIAERFTALFERDLWPELAGAASDATALAGLTTALERLGELASQVTALALERALRDEAARFVERHLS